MKGDCFVVNGDELAVQIGRRGDGRMGGYCFRSMYCLEALSKASTRGLPNLLVEQRCFGIGWVFFRDWLRDSLAGCRPLATARLAAAATCCSLFLLLVVDALEGLVVLHEGRGMID